MSDDVKSPCVRICRPDNTGLCFGCKRTTSEISGWYNMSNDMKQAVINDIKERK